MGIYWYKTSGPVQLYGQLLQVETLSSLYALPVIGWLDGSSMWGDGYILSFMRSLWLLLLNPRSWQLNYTMDFSSEYCDYDSSFSESDAFLESRSLNENSKIIFPLVYSGMETWDNARSSKGRSRTILDRWNSRILGSNKAEGIDICVVMNSALYG